jgi:hypothetical protein
MKYVSDLHDDAPPVSGRLAANGFADESAKPAGFFPVIWVDAAPGHEGWQGGIVAALQRIWCLLSAKICQFRHLLAYQPP